VSEHAGVGEPGDRRDRVPGEREHRSFLKDGAERVNLDLVDTTVIPSGVAILTYQPVR
jgi:hypothetical protein